MSGLILFSGNWWVYPDHIAQGWDATLGHTSYYRLRKEALHFLERENIDVNSVGTVFPAIGPFEWYDLNDNMKGFHAFDADSSQYVFYSNIMNDFPDETIIDFKLKWRELAKFTSPTVDVYIFKKPE